MRLRRHLAITLSLFLSLSLLTPSLQSAHASSKTILRILSLELTPTTIKVVYDQELGCPIGEPQLQLLNNENVVISKSYPPQSLDSPLTAMLLIDFEKDCTRKTGNRTATITFPNELSVSNVTPFRFSFLADPENESVSVTTSTRELRFLAVTQEQRSFEEFTSSENRESLFKLEEFWFQPGKEPIRAVLGNKNINTILGTTKEGIVVKTFNRSDQILTWLVTTKKWELLSKKVIYIEPGTLSKDKKWLIGRKVADGPSTRFYAQNLATGAISILFDVTKNGGGYICGGMADEQQKYIYFSHIAKSKTTVYRVDTSNRKIKSIGQAMKGFCVSDVMEDGRVVGLVRDAQSKAVNVVFANATNPDSALSLKTPSFLAGGDGNSHLYSDKSLIVLHDNFKSSLYLANYMTPELWEGPIKLSSNLQFVNPIPTSWRNTTQRPVQP